MSPDTQAPGKPPVGQPVSIVGHILPWYRNQLCAGTIGAAVLAWANGHWHLGLPTQGTAGLAIGLGLMWGLHTVLLDLEGLRATNATGQGYDSMLAAWAKVLDGAMPAIMEALLATLQASTRARARPGAGAELGLTAAMNPSARSPEPHPD